MTKLRKQYRGVRIKYRSTFGGWIATAVCNGLTLTAHAESKEEAWWLIVNQISACLEGGGNG